MKRHFLSFIALFAATVGFAQPEPSAEMSMDTLSGCAPLTVHFTFKSISNTDTLILITGDGSQYMFVDMADLDNPVAHVYNLHGRYIPVVNLIQWTTQKDSLGNDQRVRSVKRVISPDTLSVMNCGGIPFKDYCEWSVSCHKYRTFGDTVVNGKTYLTVYKDEFWNPETGTGRTISYALIRYDMDTKCLYGIPVNTTQPLNSLSESLLYDFSMQVGDSVTITSFDRYHDLVAKCVGRDSVTLRNGEKRAALRIRIINPKDQWGEPDGYDETIWIEGIGSNYGLFSPDCKDEYDCVYEILRLLCYHEQGELLLDFPEFDRDSTPGDCYYKKVGGSVPHVTAAQFLSVCPNPARDQVVVKVSDPAALNGELSLTNMLGEVVYRGFIKNSETTLSLQGLANGMYIAVYRSAKGVQQFRFMKE